MGILNRLKLIPRGRSRKDACYIAGSPLLDWETFYYVMLILIVMKIFAMMH